MHPLRQQVQNYEYGNGAVCKRSRPRVSLEVHVYVDGLTFSQTVQSMARNTGRFVMERDVVFRMHNETLSLSISLSLSLKLRIHCCWYLVVHHEEAAAPSCCCRFQAAAWAMSLDIPAAPASSAGKT